MTLTKAELADLLFEKVGLNKREAKDMVEGFFEEVAVLQDGELLVVGENDGVYVCKSGAGGVAAMVVVQAFKVG